MFILCQINSQKKTEQEPEIPERKIIGNKNEYHKN